MASMNRKYKVLLTRRLARQLGVETNLDYLTGPGDGHQVELQGEGVGIETPDRDEVNSSRPLTLGPKNGHHLGIQNGDTSIEIPGRTSEKTHSADEVDNMVGDRDVVDTSVGVREDDAKRKLNQFYPFSVIDFFGISISVVFFCIDFLTDILLAKGYYDDGMMFECILTSSLVASSFLVTGIMSSIWHTQEKPRRNICLVIVRFPFATIERYEPEIQSTIDKTVSSPTGFGKESRLLDWAWRCVGIETPHRDEVDSSRPLTLGPKNGHHVGIRNGDTSIEIPSRTSEKTHSADEVDNMVGDRDVVDTSVGVREDDSKRKLNQFYPFSVIDFFGISISVVFFCIDFLTDILLAKGYYDDGMMFECILTSSLVASSFLVTGIMSSIWHTQEKPRRNICLVIVLFPFATIERNIAYVFHGCKSKQETNKEYHYIEMIYNDRDASLLRMFDAFIESAPQLILQIYLILREQENLNDCGDISIRSHIIRLFTILSSWVSVSWSVTAYYRALRVSNAMHITKQRTIFAAAGYLLWRAFEIGPRVLALVMIILMSPIVFILIIIFHWFIFVTWSFATKVKPYKKRHENVIFVLFIGFVQLFSFMNVSSGKSRYHALLYYSFFYIENTAILVLWIFIKKLSFCPWIYYGTIGIVSTGLLFNLVFIASFYKLCHPKTAIC